MGDLLWPHWSPHLKQNVPSLAQPWGPQHPQLMTESPGTGRGRSLALEESRWGPRSKRGPDPLCAVTSRPGSQWDPTSQVH